MEETLQYFLDAIAAAAYEDAHGVELETAAAREEIRARLEKEAGEKSAWLQKEGTVRLESENTQLLAARRTENRRELLEKRKQYAREILVKVKAKTRGYTTLPEYPERLLALVEKALAGLGRPPRAVVYLRREDRIHWSYLANRIQGVEVTVAEGDFSLGGVVVACPEWGMRADLTFDTAFQDAADRFGELTGLGLE